MTLEQWRGNSLPTFTVKNQFIFIIIIFLVFSNGDVESPNSVSKMKFRLLAYAHKKKIGGTMVLVVCG